MSGIAGIYSPLKMKNVNDRIELMTESLRHRGPDAISFESSNNIALGNVKLKTFDLSNKTNKPIIDPEKKYSIVFDGEIYNLGELRSCLHYNFKNNSDIEVILAVVLEKGLNWFLDKVNGIYAMCIYDSFENELFLIRDKLGVKPLYYTVLDNILLFGSEIKAILNSGLIQPEFNNEAIDIYLANRYVFEPYTFFKNVYQIEAGTYVKAKIDNNNINITKSKYWDLPDMNLEEVNDDYYESYLIKLTEEKIIESVNSCLSADVPIGSFLSGGLDSSLITAIAALSMGKSFNTYIIGFEDREYNEFNYARNVSEQYKTKHHEILINKNDYLQEWDNLIYFKDGPLGVPNEIPLALLSKEAKKQIDVVLSGEGADELFGGYGRIFRLPFYYENNFNEEYYDLFVKEYEYVPRDIRDNFLNLSFYLREEFDELNKKMFDNKDKRESIFTFFHKRHIQGLLLRLNTATIQASIQARVPFINHELIEFVYKNIPYNLKLKWKNSFSLLEARNLHPKYFSETMDTPKYILKKLSEKYLTNDIIYRRKVGFPVPLNHWFSYLKELTYDEMDCFPWFKYDKIDEFMKSVTNSERSGQILWMFLNITKFYKIYFSRKWTW